MSRLTDEEVRELKMGPRVRQTSPLQPPPSFDEAYQLAMRNDPKLAGEHARLRPNEIGNAERFKAQMQPPPLNAIPQFSGAPTLQPLGRVLPPAPALGSANYPAWRYHPTQAPTGILVNDPDHEEQVAPPDQGWVDSKSKLPKDVTQGPTTANKLELLEEMLTLLGCVAEPTETPIQALERIIDERDAFAVRLAKLEPEPEKKSKKGE